MTTFGLAKIDGVLCGVESSEIGAVLSLLDEIVAISPAIDPARQKLKSALRMFQGVQLTVSETTSLYMTVQNLGALETTLRVSHPKFLAQFNRFRSELESAMVQKKGLEFQWQQKYERRPPTSDLNRDPGLRKLLKYFMNPQVFESGVNGHVMEYHDAKSKEIVIIYLDMHSADNQRDIVAAVSKLWLPAGFRQFQAENINYEDGELTAQIPQPRYYVESLLSQCPGNNNEVRRVLADKIIGLNYFNALSPLALECLFGGGLYTIGVDSRQLLNEIDKFGDQQLVHGPGFYRYVDQIDEIHRRRDDEMASHSVAELRRKGKFGQKAVLLLGFHHSAALKTAYKKQGISYVEILPQSADYVFVNDSLRLAGKASYRF